MGISHFGQQKGSFISLVPLHKEALRCGFCNDLVNLPQNPMVK